MKRSAINELVKELGHDPADVCEVSIKYNVVIVTRLSRDRRGEPIMGLFGVETNDVYHGIDNDVEDLDDQAPDGPRP